ncbi:MAG: FtsX-like permease family protein [Sporolactobacillus sp.]
MRHIVLLTKATIRKNRGTAIVFILLAVLAGFLLNSGSLISNGFAQLLSDSVQRAHSASFSAILPDADYRASYERFLKHYHGSERAEKETMLIASNVTMQAAGRDTMSGSALLIRKVAMARQLSQLSFIAKLSHVPAHPMYLPYKFCSSNGYQLGDSVTVKLSNQRFHYTIAGFTEETLFIQGGMAYLTNNDYQQLKKKLGPSARAIMVSAQLKHPFASARLAADFSKQITRIPHFYDNRSLDGVRSYVTSNTAIYGGILRAFGLLILIVCTLIVAFRISYTITRDMPGIGALLAIGYRPQQIAAAFISQFTLLALVGATLGVAISYVLMPFFGDALAASIGMRWTSLFQAAACVTTIGAVTATSCIAAAISARRIHRLTPILALRGGIATHNFHRNRLPLSRTRLGLCRALALKMIAGHRTQNLLIATVLTFIVITVIFASTAYTNFVGNSHGLLQMIGVEPFQIYAEAADGRDTNQLAGKIAELPAVRKVLKSTSATVLCDGRYIGSGSVISNYAALDLPTLYAGRYPKHANEAAIGGQLAARLGKTVGDSISLSPGTAAGSIKRTFLITGLTQSTNYFGMDVNLTMNGLRTINPGYHWQSLDVYLRSGANRQSTIRLIKQMRRPRASVVNDEEAAAEQGLRGISTAVRLIVILIDAITTMLAFLILLLIVQMMIARQRRTFGILKAQGMTTLQLTRVIAGGVLPPAVIGCGAGIVIGLLAVNPFLSLMLRGMGIMHAKFMLPAAVAVLDGIAVALMTYLITLAIASGVRKVTPMELMEE